MDCIGHFCDKGQADNFFTRLGCMHSQPSSPGVENIRCFKVQVDSGSLRGGEYLSLTGYEKKLFQDFLPR